MSRRVRGVDSLTQGIPPQKDLLARKIAHGQGGGCKDIFIPPRCGGAKSSPLTKQGGRYWNNDETGFLVRKLGKERVYKRKGEESRTKKKKTSSLGKRYGR